MSRRSGLAMALSALLLPLLSVPTIAEGPGAPASTGVRAEMMVFFKDAEDKLTQLAEATPEAQYAYRPGKGVRSTGEVFMHVAAANYGVPNFWGVAPPEGFKFATYEQSLTKKADIQKALKDSFAHMERAFLAMSDADLDKPAEFFGIKSTIRGGYVLLLSHVHEHLGQSIAYARVNGIVPPWTAKQQAAAAEKEKAAKPASK